MNIDSKFQLLNEDEIYSLFENFLNNKESYLRELHFNGKRPKHEIIYIISSDYYKKNFKKDYGLTAVNVDLVKKWQSSFKKRNLQLKPEIEKTKDYYSSRIMQLLDEYPSSISNKLKDARTYWQNRIKVIRIKDRLIDAMNTISTNEELEEFKTDFNEKINNEMDLFRSQIKYNYENSSKDADFYANEMIKNENAKKKKEENKQMRSKRKKANKRNKLNYSSHKITSLFVKFNYFKKKQRYKINIIKKFIKSFLIRKEYNEKNKPKFKILKNSRKIIFYFFTKSIYILKKMIKYKKTNIALHKITSIICKYKYRKNLLKVRNLKYQNDGAQKIKSIFLKNMYYKKLLKYKIIKYQNNASHIITSLFIKNKYNKKKIRDKIIKKKFNIGDAVSSTLSNSKIQKHWGNVIEVKGDKLKVQSAKSTSFITSDISNWTHYINVGNYIDVR